MNDISRDYKMFFGRGDLGKWVGGGGGCLFYPSMFTLNFFSSASQ